ncbi:hypothetical protein [Jannaschia faecimaris]|nr:hypothetical protein [Jannaschia faecimaris]
MILITGIIVDTSNTFYSYSYVNRSIHDGDRKMSIGIFKTAAETEAYIESQIQDVYPAADATVQIDGNMVVTTVDIPWTSLRMMGILANSQSAPVTFTASHRLEWMP